MSLAAVSNLAKDIPAGEPLLAAMILGAAVEDYNSKNERRRQDAARFLFGDWAGHLFAGLGLDPAAIRAGLERHARNKHIRAPRQRRRQTDMLRI